MPMFGIFLLQDLDDEKRAHLEALIGAVGLTPPAASTPPPGGSPAPDQGEAGRLIQGVVTWGDVSIEWSDGRPLRGWRASNPTNASEFPPGLWEVILAGSPRERWMEWAYLGFPESNWRADAHNGAGEDSWGVWQVNRRAWPQYGVEYLTTYAGNLEAAEYIYSVQGWAAWLNSARLIGLL